MCRKQQVNYMKCIINTNLCCWIAKPSAEIHLCPDRKVVKSPCFRRKEVTVPFHKIPKLHSLCVIALLLAHGELSVVIFCILYTGFTL